jgi:hypothetical protein
MSRRQKNPLRALTTEECQWLPTDRTLDTCTGHARRARQADSCCCRRAQLSEAAPRAGRRSGDAVAHLIARFTREGAQAIEPRAGGGSKPKYGMRERERILAEVRRAPAPETDGTATWALITLRRA